jgi:hypothetical protein
MADGGEPAEEEPQVRRPPRRGKRTPFARQTHGCPAARLHPENPRATLRPTLTPAQAEPLPSTLAEGWKHGFYVTPDLDCEGGAALVCVNAEAVWRLSGARPGNGIEALLDGNVRGRFD